MSVAESFDRFGQSYNVTAVLTPDIHLNLTAYKSYSPVYLPATFNMTYLLSFALLTSAIVHTVLYHGPRVYHAILGTSKEPMDIHMKLMSRYPEAPDWWYIAVFLFCFATGVIAIEVFDTGLPVWGFLVSILLPFIYFLPAAFIFAMTSQPIAINLVAELIPGYIFPGKPIPGMVSFPLSRLAPAYIQIFKTYAVQVVVEGLNFVQNKKLGHYMKIPPRHTFFAQLSASAICGLIQVATKTVLFKAVPDICDDYQKDRLTCPTTRVFYSASIIW